MPGRAITAEQILDFCSGVDVHKWFGHHFKILGLKI